MNRIIIALILVLTIASKAKCQTMNDAFFVGTWKVKKMEVLKTSEDLGSETQMQIIKKAFLNAIFEFKSDHKFNFKFELKEMEIKNEYWKFNSLKKLITVNQYKDFIKNKSLTMEFRVIVENTKTYFLMEEIPFKLEVEKE